MTEGYIRFMCICICVAMIGFGYQCIMTPVELRGGVYKRFLESIFDSTIETKKVSVRVWLLEERLNLLSDVLEQEAKHE